MFANPFIWTTQRVGPGLVLGLVLGGFLGVGEMAQAQETPTATLRGFVTEQATGVPLQGVNVVLRRASETGVVRVSTAGPDWPESSGIDDECC